MPNQTQQQQKPKVTAATLTEKGGKLYRYFEIDRAKLKAEDEDGSRTLEVSFSSEDIEIDRWFGFERLSHDPTSIRLDRFNNGAAVLVNHSSDDQVGVLERAWIDEEEKKGRAEIRFSKSSRATEIWNDVRDQIRRNVSVGYKVHELKLEAEDDQGDHYRITDWEPLELSIVAVPADPNIGFGRSLKEEVKIMDPIETVPAQTSTEIAVRERSDDAERTRIEAIELLGAKLNAPDLARTFIATGKSADEFRTAWLADQENRQKASLVPNGTPGGASNLGLSEKDVKRYSLMRAIRALIGLGTRKEAEYEFELSDQIGKNRGVPATGFYVPYERLIQAPHATDHDLEVFERMAKYYGQRLTSVGTTTTPGNAFRLVGTEHKYESFIEMLYNNLVTKTLGVSILAGLTQNVQIPKQTGSVTGAWVAEGVAAPPSDLAIGYLNISPKTFSANTEFTRMAMLQSLPQIEQLILSDMAMVDALAIDKAILSGSGLLGEPLGILNTPGVNVVTQAGAAFSYADAVAMETKVLEANAGFPGMAYVGRPGVRGILKTRPELDSGTDNPMMTDNTLNGYPFEVTMQMPAATIIFGAFSQVVLAEWGTLEIRVNPYGANANAGNVEVYSFQTVDVAIRYPQAFSKLTNFAIA